MKIVCASSVLLGEEAFATLGDVKILPEREITPHAVRDADVLITRSKVKVNAHLLEGSRVAFVGTATAGTDHFDLRDIEARNIAWCSAPGCNANSVAEYVVAALLFLADRYDFTLAGKTMAIVGVGHVGREVMKKAEALGLRILLNDPPLFDESGDEKYKPLDEILPHADVVTLHVPWTEEGPYRTRNLANAAFFSRLKPGCLFVNACRGEVVETDALLAALEKRIVKHAVLDVFENEPTIRKDIAQKADLITPHIAGYSYEGKLKGTWMVYREVCNFLEVAPSWIPPFASHEELPAGASLEELIGKAYDIEADDRAFRKTLGEDAETRGKLFEKLRQNYPVRHEFPYYTVDVSRMKTNQAQKIKGLGFRVRD